MRMIHVPSANRTNDLRQHAYTYAEAAARFRSARGRAFSRSLSAPVPANRGRGGLLGALQDAREKGLRILAITDGILLLVIIFIVVNMLSDLLSEAVK